MPGGQEDDVFAHGLSEEDIEINSIPPNPLERLNKEIKRRAIVIGIFPNDNAIFASSAR